MKILITGIDGFLGRAIAESLHRDEHQIVGISNGQTVGDFEFYKIDITDRPAVFEIFQKANADLCIHLAALAHADVGPEQEGLVRAVNVNGALNVADAAQEHGCKKLIYFSTAKVLADSTPSIGLDEKEDPKPLGVYPELKREVELDLLSRNESGELSVAIVRPVAVIGPGDIRGNYAKLIRTIDRGFFPLLDGGNARRSIVFSDRVAMRVALMVRNGIVGGRAYTFSDGAFTLSEIVDAIRIAKGFAWCPSVPVGTLKSAAPLVDNVLARVGFRKEPVKNVLKRLTDSFVVNTHLFEEDYGSLPSFNLKEAMIKACLD